MSNTYPSAASSAIHPLVESGGEKGGGVKVGTDQPSTDTIERGREALKRLERATWPDWIAVANALAAGRTIVMREAKVNKPEGPHYRESMSKWYRDFGFDRIDKGDRSRLLKVAGNLVAINAWRDGLPPERRLQLNNPRTVLAAWERAKAEFNNKLSESRCARATRKRLRAAAAEYETASTQALAWLRDAPPGALTDALDSAGFDRVSAALPPGFVDKLSGGLQARIDELIEENTALLDKVTELESRLQNGASAQADE